jgi:polyhydroxyalkanoate synthesis repressor PhaR
MLQCSIASDGTVVIRKYGNRRVYDTARSRYVNLEEVAAMVRNGLDVRVVDSATGADITRAIPAQIVVESARSPRSGLPLEILRQMVIVSRSHDLMAGYMRAMFDIYCSAVGQVSRPVEPAPVRPKRRRQALQ